MLCRGGALALPALLLAACSSVPGFDVPETPSGAPTVYDVIAKIECEVAQARDENSSADFNNYLQTQLSLAPFSKWAASVTISLTVNDTGGFNSSSGLTLSYLRPLANPATQFAFDGSLQLYQNRSRIFTQTYTLDISKASVNVCKRFDGTLARINIAGDLGLRDQIHMGLHAFRRDDASDYWQGSPLNQNKGDPTDDNPGAGGAPDSFGATASFDVFKGATGVGPVWTFSRFVGPTGGVGYLRDDLNKVVITFVPVTYTAPTFHKDNNGQWIQSRSTVSPAARAAAQHQAQTANQVLVQVQAIQSLGQILSNRP
jgi:hypothetical protein